MFAFTLFCIHYMKCFMEESELLLYIILPLKSMILERSATPKNKGRSKGWKALKSGVSSLAVGSYLQGGSAPSPQTPYQTTKPPPPPPPRNSYLHERRRGYVGLEVEFRHELGLCTRLQAPPAGRTEYPDL